MWAEALAAITGIGRAIETLTGLRDKVQAATTAEQRRTLRMALRQIYFPPNSLQRTLDEIAEGHEIDRRRALARLDAFEGAEHAVAAAMRDLKFDSEAFLDGLSLGEKTALQELAWGKQQLRYAVTTALQDHLLEDRPIPTREAARLRDAIHDLNRAIDAFEQQLGRA